MSYFPYLRNSTTVGNYSGASTIGYNLPTYKVGDYVVVVLVAEDPPTSTPSGWTQINSSSYASVVMHVYARWMTDTNTTDITFSFSSSVCTVVCFWTIFGVHPDGINGLVAGVSGTASNPNPANLNTGTSRKYLWLISQGNDGTAYAGGPTNYTDEHTVFATAVISASSSWRAYEGASEDPGAFTGITPANWLTWVIAIRPGAEPTATGGSAFGWATAGTGELAFVFGTGASAFGWGIEAAGQSGVEGASASAFGWAAVASGGSYYSVTMSGASTFGWGAAGEGHYKEPLEVLYSRLAFGMLRRYKPRDRRVL